MNRLCLLACCCAALPALAQTPSFDSATGRLTLPEVLIGEQTYSNGVLFLGADGRYSVLSLTAGKTVGEADSGATLELVTGQFLTIKLKANPSTGYAWQLNNQSSNVLAAQGDAVYAADTPVLAGSGGSYAWKFKATATGSGTLRFDYGRPGDNALPLLTVQYSITVK